MVSYAWALKTVLDNFRVLAVEEREVYNCGGQVLAEDIYSDYSLPLKDCAAQDGYAVKASDIQGASKNKPINLRVIETVRAGSLPVNPVEPGTAIRIMTGAVLPEGADCVIRFEDTDEPENKNRPNVNSPSQVKIQAAGTPDTNVRKAGTNIAKGSLVLPKGTVIGPNQISVLIAIGKAIIKVIRRPVLAVISTGDELISPGRPLSPDKSYNCNTSAVGAMVKHYGGTPQILGVARDYETSILAKIRRGLGAAAIITSGGVSKGDFDLVRKVLEKFGEVRLSRIRMGPGASFTFGIINKLPKTAPVPVFALAGPPAGCMINFETLVKPAILKMKGLTALYNPAIEATVEDSIETKIPMDFVKWTILRKENGEYRVSLNGSDNSGILVSMAQANSLTIIPEGTEVKKGDKVKVYPLDWCQEYKPGL